MNAQTGDRPTSSSRQGFKNVGNSHLDGFDYFDSKGFNNRLHDSSSSWIGFTQVFIISSSSLRRPGDDLPRSGPLALCVSTDKLVSPLASPESNRSVFLGVWSPAHPRISKSTGVEKSSSSRCPRPPATQRHLVHPAPVGQESPDAPDEQTLCRCAPAVQIFLCPSLLLFWWLP